MQALCHFRIGYKTYHYEVKPPRRMPGGFAETVEKPSGFFQQKVCSLLCA